MYHKQIHHIESQQLIKTAFFSLSSINPDCFSVCFIQDGKYTMKRSTL